MSSSDATLRKHVLSDVILQVKYFCDEIDDPRAWVARCANLAARRVAFNKQNNFSRQSFRQFRIGTAFDPDCPRHQRPATALSSLRTLASANLIIMLPMEIRCRGLLFDMDGVLVDSTPAVARVWAAWAGKYGFEPADVVRRAHGRPSIATIRELLPLGDHHAEDQAIENAEIGDVEDLVALPGTKELLSALSPDRFAVVTSATKPLAIVRIRAAGFAIPKHLVTASDIRRGKPDPEPYLRGAQALGIPPGRMCRDRGCARGDSVGQSGRLAGPRFTHHRGRSRLAPRRSRLDRHRL